MVLHGEQVVPIFINEAAYYYVQSGRGIGIATPVDLALEAEPLESAVTL